MDLFGIITILIVLTALFGYINTRFLKMPHTIGLMMISLVVTLGIIGIGYFSESFSEYAKELVISIDFQKVLLDVMLSFLLFAGALHTDMNLLKKHRWPILMFATFGILISTFLIGTAFYYLMALIGFEINYIHALLFGALISPTDPIAVLGVLKEAKAPKNLEIKIVGESLFNDGIGVVIFLTVFKIAEVGLPNVTPNEIAILFLKEVVGGIVAGLFFGYIAYKLIKQIDHYQTEVMISLALAMGAYYFATIFHISGPLAVVVAGLFIGNTARNTAISKETELYLDKFWELLDVLLNAVLFVLIGMELIVLTFNQSFLIGGLLSIPMVLIARYIALSLPILYFKKKLDFAPRTGIIMTWGGLRGGISIALALSLPKTIEYRDLILTTTYIIVIFSIIGQGLTLKRLVKKIIG